MNVDRLVKRITQAIWADCRDRSGLDLGCLPDETQTEIMDAWEIETKSAIQQEFFAAAEEI